MTRTQWLLVALIGLVAWIAGYVLKEPIFGIPGFVALVVGVSRAAIQREA